MPEPAPAPRPAVYAEAVSRLASVRHALSLVDTIGDGPSSDVDDDLTVALAWDDATEAQQRCFDRRSQQLVGATAAGVESLLAQRGAGREPHVAASQALIDDIRRELADIARIVVR